MILLHGHGGVLKGPLEAASCAQKSAAQGFGNWKDTTEKEKSLPQCVEICTPRSPAPLQQPSLSASPSALPFATRVVLRDLQSKPEPNGKRGLVVGSEGLRL